MTDRWDAFSEKEMAAITMGFAGNLMMMVSMTNTRVALAYAKDVIPMLEEISEKMGAESDSMRDVRDMIAKIEEHRQ